MLGGNHHLSFFYFFHAHSKLERTNVSEKKVLSLREKKVIILRLQHTIAHPLRHKVHRFLSADLTFSPQAHPKGGEGSGINRVKRELALGLSHPVIAAIPVPQSPTVDKLKVAIISTQKRAATTIYFIVSKH